MAELYRTQGRYAEAEPLYERALTVGRKAFGRHHPTVATRLNSLAEVYRLQGRYTKAEPLYKRALAISEKAWGPDHAIVSTSLNNLALLYAALGRYTEAEPFHKRALAISEKGLGPNHPTVGIRLNNLAELYRFQGRYAESEPLYKRALAVSENALGPDHASVTIRLNNLALLYRAQGRFAEAEPLHQRALAVSEKVLGSDHPTVALRLSNLGGHYRAQGRYAEAEPLYLRSLAVREKVLVPDHPAVGDTLSGLAELYFAQRDWARAAELWRRSTEVIIRRLQRGTRDQALTDGAKDEAERLSYRFWALIKAAHRLVPHSSDAESTLAAEMFQIAQWAQSSDAAASLAQMSARQAKGSGPVATIVRERQELLGEWQALDKLLTGAVSQAPDGRNADVEQVQRSRLRAINRRIAEIDRELAKDFPDYAAFVSPAPVSIPELQALLRDNEVLLLFIDTPSKQSTPEETFTWVVTKTESRWMRSVLGTPSLRREVAALRCGLDHALWKGGEAQDRCVEMLNNKQSYQANINGEIVDILPFDLQRAHALYKALLGPGEELMKDKHLLIVPSGPLANLPLHVLVTEPPKIRIASTLAEYRDVAWLATRQPITVLPSVASLKALRTIAKTSGAGKLYLGIGNPLLNGPQDHPQWGEYYRKQAAVARDHQHCMSQPARLQIASARGRRSAASSEQISRRGQADIEEVRRCTPLPETANELCEVGRRLGVAESEILLGASATETRLKQLSEQGQLADYAILHFATHGALPAQVEGVAEPGLILTPPEAGTSDIKALDRDDGFLTASEIGTLKLDADWVVLSACNTAGPQGENAEALSGLARAFFYAGARALAVSHWEVGSGAAVKLATRAFAEAKANPRIGRADAFRISMRELIDKGTLFDAHPSQWAPFVLVGEGAAPR